MTESKKYASRPFRLGSYMLAIMLSWTSVTAISLAWSIAKQKRLTLHHATIEARVHFEKDQAFRFWATGHGGVYVPVTERTPPNPHLVHLAHRDIITDEGKKLTLLNPAYMLRQLHDNYTILYGVTGHITSLKPLRPENAPDEWETTALEAFDRGATEFTERSTVNGQAHLRLMRPMITQIGCLKCHGIQGYQAGDVRGGVSVSVPLTVYLAQERQEILYAVRTHGLFWFLGCIGIGFGYHALRKRYLERLAAEAALRTSERSLAEAQRIAHLGNWALDLENNDLVLSDEALRIFGLPRHTSDLTFEAFMETVHPEDREYVRGAYGYSLNNNTPYDIVHRISRADGEVRYVHEKAENIMGENGVPIRSIGTVHDITDRKTAETALRESEEKYRLLVENAEEAIFINQDDVMKFPNPKTEEMLGYVEAELARTSFVKLIHPDDRDQVAERLGERTNGEDITGDHSFRILNKNGEYIWGELNVAPVIWEGKPATLNFLRNITVQKKLEVKLRQSHKMEAIGTLAGGIAHDFNNILSAAIGYTELSIDQAKPGTLLHDNLREVLNAGKRAKDLVLQILTFSRQREQMFQPIQVRLIVKEALRLLRATLPANIEIDQDIQCDTMVMGDPTQIHQVIMNLCTNAGHAMKENGGTLSVQLAPIEFESDFDCKHLGVSPGHYLRLTVSDTGHGISPEFLDRIFDPFFTTKETNEGTGMGLSVVHGIIKDHGGAITVYSELEKGASFKIVLPTIASDEEMPGTEKAPIPGGREKVLFIDDEPVLVRLGKQLLESLGYDVVATTDSVEALEVFSAAPDRFDIVITDMTMPKMTGEDLAARLMRIRPDIPVILCTGFSSKIDREKAEALGIREFVSKPILKRDMANRIRDALQNE